MMKAGRGDTYEERGRGDSDRERHGLALIDVRSTVASHIYDGERLYLPRGAIYILQVVGYGVDLLHRTYGRMVVYYSGDIYDGR